MKRTRLICVGAACIDTILTVPRFPAEDSKLRATSLRKSRGGNTPNTLEVLQQLINQNQAQPYLELFLIATLPARECADSRFIACSLDPECAASTANSRRSSHELISEDQWSRVTLSNRHKVDISHSIFREDYAEAVSAYIINSEATSSRTIVNHNALPEVTFEEFKETTHLLLDPAYIWYTDPSAIGDAHPDVDVIWFHFEGRIPETTLQCMRYLRLHDIFKERLELRISVELEKPGREGLDDLAREADVIFYSKAWAQGEGYVNAKTCVERQAEILSNPTPAHGMFDYRILVCTWGEQGSVAAVLAPPGGKPRVATRYARAYIPSDYMRFPPPIVDSTGAGDTFIAGMLFAMTGRNEEYMKYSPWALDLAMGLANHLAGHKILQHGFQGLAKLSCISNRKMELEWQ